MAPTSNRSDDRAEEPLARRGVPSVAGVEQFMNRLLEGHVVHGGELLHKSRGSMLKKHGYPPLIRTLQS